ncbi:hypothetical protein E2C01_049075 [Portunus trituberculatus]|uniref:Uncharacterized protein n=1 Tax=Portunus trituberculatus TaxID=210409 RepID=A0A5B7GF29_PORTR|nr:hypothetical protein [Portunus trituberculatus]
MMLGRTTLELEAAHVCLCPHVTWNSCTRNLHGNLRLEGNCFLERVRGAAGSRWRPLTKPCCM